MANDYKETTVVGSRWHRFGRVVINNPRGGFPSVSCVEQEVLSIGEAEEIVRDVGNLDFAFNASEEIPVLDPLTMQPTGITATMGDVYTLVFSAVMAKAKARDEAEAGGANGDRNA